MPSRDTGNGSMMLSIHPEDASRVLAASKVFAEALPNNSSKPRDQRAKVAEIVTAAKQASAQNPLLDQFVRYCTTQTPGSAPLSDLELSLSLLLYIDVDKSTKLLTAFEILSEQQDHGNPFKNAESTSVISKSNSDDENISGHANGATTGNGNSKSDTKMSTGNPNAAADQNDDDDETSLQLAYKDLVKLFEHVLLSISYGCHSQNAMNMDARRSEIANVSKFAADRLFQSYKSDANKDNHGTKDKISFEVFGDWYNSGGYELVPWLELLDLAKWDSSAQRQQQQEQQQNHNQQQNQQPQHTASLTPPPIKEPLHSAHVPGPVNPQRCVVSFDFSGTTPNNRPLHVNITEENLYILQTVVESTGLATLGTDAVIDAILDGGKSSRGFLSMRGFVQTMRKLCKVLNNSHHSALFAHMFESLYSCLDLDGTDAVNCTELAVGLTFFCSGSKSAKLARAFDLMGSSGGNHHMSSPSSQSSQSSSPIITNHELARYFRSYLAMLVGLSQTTLSDPNDHRSRMTLTRQDMYCAIHNGSEWTMSHVLSSRGEISFEQFAEWYTDGGFNVAPWLELLDLKKFTSLLNDTPEIATEDDTSTVLTQPTEPPNTDVMFTFPLAKGNSLIVLKDDVIYVRKVVHQLGLTKISPDAIWDALKAYPTMTNAQFVNTMCSLLAHNNVRVDNEVQILLQNYQSSFDIHQTGYVPSNQLAGGLTLLCDGRKSHKLAFSFQLFSGDGMSPLKSEDLFYFLRSFLIVLFSCCAQSLELTADQVSAWVTDTAKMCCRDVMHHTSRKECVDFGDFGEWYNGGGYETAPWLELLDLGKWALSPDIPGPAPSNTTPPPENLDEGMEPINFHLLTHDNHPGHFVSISAHQVARLKRLLTVSNLSQMETKMVCQHIMSCADASGTISKVAFDGAMRSLIHGDMLSVDVKDSLSEFLTAIFFSFVRGPALSVPAEEFACGFSVLCGGKKSDKLECAFDLFDRDHDGKLMLREVTLYLRSFVTIFLCVSNTNNHSGGIPFDIVDGASSWATKKIFDDLSLPSGLLSFDEFANWYTQGGYGCMPWLELLDLRKWVLA